MIIIHILFALSSFISFIGRVALLELKPALLNEKFFKVAPHVIDSFLLASGIGLVLHGDWIETDNYTWIVSKFAVLVAYVSLGVLTMRLTGVKRWIAFVSAVACYGYILTIAVNKQGFF